MQYLLDLHKKNNFVLDQLDDEHLLVLPDKIEFITKAIEEHHEKLTWKPKTKGKEGKEEFMEEDEEEE